MNRNLEARLDDVLTSFAQADEEDERKRKAGLAIGLGAGGLTLGAGAVATGLMLRRGKVKPTVAAPKPASAAPHPTPTPVEAPKPRLTDAPKPAAPAPAPVAHHAPKVEAEPAKPLSEKLRGARDKAEDFIHGRLDKAVKDHHDYSKNHPILRRVLTPGGKKVIKIQDWMIRRIEAGRDALKRRIDSRPKELSMTVEQMIYLSEKLDVVLFEKKKDNEDKLANTGIAVGSAASAAAIPGAAMLASSKGPGRVSVSYGYDGHARGHLSQAEDVEKLLKESGIDASKKVSRLYTSHANINTGYGFNPPWAVGVGHQTDYKKETDKVLPVAPDKVAAHKPARKRTVGIYGGGSGVGGSEIARELQKLNRDSYDGVHVYAGTSKREVEKSIADLDPEYRKKVKVHGKMKRKAIENANRVHHVNIAYPGLSTIHEAAASEAPALVVDHKDAKYHSRTGTRGRSTMPHLAKNVDWADHNKVLPVVRMGDENKIAPEVQKILDNPNEARKEASNRSKGFADSAAESKKRLVDDVKSAIEKGKRRHRIIGGALTGVGLAGAATAITAGAIKASRNREKKKLKELSSKLDQVIEFSARSMYSSYEILKDHYDPPVSEEEERRLALIKMRRALGMERDREHRAEMRHYNEDRYYDDYDYDFEARVPLTEFAQIPLRGRTLKTAQEMVEKGVSANERKLHVMRPLKISDKKSLDEIRGQTARIKRRGPEGRRQSVTNAVDDYLRSFPGARRIHVE